MPFLLHQALLLQHYFDSALHSQPGLDLSPQAGFCLSCCIHLDVTCNEFVQAHAIDYFPLQGPSAAH